MVTSSWSLDRAKISPMRVRTSPGVVLYLFIFLYLFAIPGRVSANVTLLLAEPYGKFGSLNPTGHAAIYLSRVCAESPTVLRRCLPSEAGVVISRYHRIGGYDWLAVPLVPYLYAVDQVGDIPSTADEALIAQLRDSYRRQHWRELVADGPSGKMPAGDWIQLAGAAYDRKIYAFEIETSEDQDDALIAELNAKPNQSHFNLFFRNCADFARAVVNFYYPRSVHRSFIADFGFTTPKQVAKSLVQYSERNHDLEFRAFVIPQVPGGLARSRKVHGVIESLVRTKKYVVPLTILQPWAVGGMIAAYLVRGRFNAAKYTAGHYEEGELLLRLGEQIPEPVAVSQEPQHHKQASAPRAALTTHLNERQYF